MALANSRDAEQGPPPPRWGIFFSVVCLEAANINCFRNKLPIDSSADTVVPTKARREPGLGVYLITPPISLTCERVSYIGGPIRR